MDLIYPTCAGLDVHKNTVTAALVTRSAGGKRHEEVRTFSTTTTALLDMREWLLHHRCPVIAMESTGIYWKPIFNLLEGDIEVMLVNPAHIKQVPGRKTDVGDAQWIAQLLEHGLLKASFIPPVEFRDLREFARHRTKLLQERTAEVNRLIKLLEGANIRVDSVASNIMGASCRAMLQAILEGESDPERLAEMAKGKLRAKRSELEEALRGLMRPHHIELLRLMLNHIDFLNEQVATCEKQMDEICRPFQQEIELLTTIPGVSQIAAQTILAETGVNMQVFPSDRHLCAWAGVAPGNHESAGKRKKQKTRPGNKHLRTILVQCAQAAGHTKNTYLGAQFRRFMRKKGVNRAAMAVAHTILEECYFILRDKLPHRELGADFYEQRNKEAMVRHHLKQLKKLGVDLPQAA
jgi:transposase